MKHKKISIIGLGLIGGSLAKVFHERLGINDITAVDKNIASINEAVHDNVICRGFCEINEHVLNSDIIFICTPVRHTIEYIDIIAKHAKHECIVTDTGSTKSEIINYVNKIPNPPCFIGGHPMAGSEKTGYSAGYSHLFENAYYVLTPCKNTTQTAMDLMIELIKAIGAIPVILDASEHDMATAGISHVPHIIASALVNMVKNEDSSGGKMQLLAAGGFKDITRIASSNPQMWESIVLSNRERIEKILDSYIKQIETFKNYMINDNAEEVYSFFESARQYRNSFSSAKMGLISPVYEIVVDVVDKPGIIGEIATILGSNNINIKNINVSNSREFEQGCLRITLPDSGSLEASFKLLHSKGYKVYKMGDR